MCLKSEWHAMGLMWEEEVEDDYDEEQIDASA